MPFKRFSRRKPTRGRKTYTKRPTAAKTIRRIAKSVILKTAETKSRASNHNEASMSTLTQSIREHTPCRVKQGTEDSERIGNDITLTGISVKGYLHNNSTSDAIHVRAVAFIDKKGIGASTTLDEFFMKNNSPVSYNQGAMSSVLDINKQRYRVLWDQVMTLSPRAAGNGSGHTRMFRKWIKTKLKVKFNNNTAGGITQNDIKVCFFCCEADGDVGLGETVELYSQAIAYYKDI